MGFKREMGSLDPIGIYKGALEEAYLEKKPLYISSNDCTQACDSVAPWAMYFIYKYHGFPDNLVNLLINLDTNQTGTILTGLGATEPFVKECGLGQGSSLAPLKWNLFLDPLLKWQRTLPDHFAIGKTEIGAIAFADDTGWFATTHSAYIKKTKVGGKYLNFFGVEMNGSKTKLLYHDPASSTPPDTCHSNAHKGKNQYSMHGRRPNGRHSNTRWPV